MVSGNAFFMAGSEKMAKRGAGHMATKAFNKVNELCIEYAKKYGYTLQYLKL